MAATLQMEIVRIKIMSSFDCRLHLLADSPPNASRHKDRLALKLKGELEVGYCDGDS